MYPYSTSISVVFRYAYDNTLNFSCTHLKLLNMITLCLIADGLIAAEGEVARELRPVPRASARPAESAPGARAQLAHACTPLVPVLVVRQAADNVEAETRDEDHKEDRRRAEAVGSAQLRNRYSDRGDQYSSGVRRFGRRTRGLCLQTLWVAVLHSMCD